jgi:uncharacterized protein YkwD
MKTVNTLTSLFLFIIFVFSCRKSDTVPANSNPATTAIDRSLMLQLVNDQRARGCNCGSTYYGPAGPVSWNGQLESAAAAHAADMNENNYFSHTGLDGSSPGDRITRTGYHWMAYGENIAKGFSTEQSVMEAWIASPDHCENIMNPNYIDFGAARVGTYWVQEFGRR